MNTWEAKLFRGAILSKYTFFDAMTKANSEKANKCFNLAYTATLIGQPYFKGESLNAFISGMLMYNYDCIFGSVPADKKEEIVERFLPLSDEERQVIFCDNYKHTSLLAQISFIMKEIFLSDKESLEIVCQRLINEFPNKENMILSFSKTEVELQNIA